MRDTRGFLLFQTPQLVFMMTGDKKSGNLIAETSSILIFHSRPNSSPSQVNNVVKLAGSPLLQIYSETDERSRI